MYPLCTITRKVVPWLTYCTATVSNHEHSSPFQHKPAVIRKPKSQHSAVSVATTIAQTGYSDCVVKSLPNEITHSTDQDRNERSRDFLAAISDVSHRRSPSSLTIHQTPGLPNYLALILLIFGYKQSSQSSYGRKMSNKQIVSNWDNWMQHLLTNYISSSSGCRSMAWLFRTEKFNRSMLTSACTALDSARRCNL